MSATGLEEVRSADCFSTSFSRGYSLKQFTADATRLRDLARLQTREKLSEAEVAEIVELRKRIRRADADAVLLAVIKVKQIGGFQFY